MANKSLTEAQVAHLRRLAEQVARAQQTVDLFVGYLREEHGAPVGEWVLRDPAAGFEPARPKQAGGER